MMFEKSHFLILKSPPSVTWEVLQENQNEQLKIIISVVFFVFLLSELPKSPKKLPINELSFRNN